MWRVPSPSNDDDDDDDDDDAAHAPPTANSVRLWRNPSPSDDDSDDDDDNDDDSNIISDNEAPLPTTTASSALKKRKRHAPPHTLPRVVQEVQMGSYIVTSHDDAERVSGNGMGGKRGRRKRRRRKAKNPSVDIPQGRKRLCKVRGESFI